MLVKFEDSLVTPFYGGQLAVGTKNAPEYINSLPYKYQLDIMPHIATVTLLYTLTLLKMGPFWSYLKTA